MAARSKARKRALDIIFECEVRGTSPGETLDELMDNMREAVEGWMAAEPPAPDRSSSACSGRC